MNELSSFRLCGIPAEMVETFVHLAFSPDGSDAARLIEQLLDDGVTPEAVMLELMGPAALLMGQMWTGDEASFLDVTLGLSRMQHLMRQFRFPVMNPVADRGSALLVPVPGAARAGVAHGRGVPDARRLAGAMHTSVRR